jgi:hypothetical protein
MSRKKLSRKFYFIEFVKVQINRLHSLIVLLIYVLITILGKHNTILPVEMSGGFIFKFISCLWKFPSTSTCYWFFFLHFILILNIPQELFYSMHTRQSDITKAAF